MSNLTNNTTESVSAIVAKAGPPVSISLATIAGYSVAEIVLWATLLYTVLMITHKLYHMWKDFTGGGKHGPSKD